MDKFSERVSEVLKEQAATRGVVGKMWFRIEDAVRERQ